MAEAANILANFGVCVFFFLPLNSEWPRLPTFWLIFFFRICVHRMMTGRTGTSRGTKKTKRNKKTNVEKKQGKLDPTTRKSKFTILIFCKMFSNILY